MVQNKLIKEVFTTCNEMFYEQVFHDELYTKKKN